MKGQFYSYLGVKNKFVEEKKKKRKMGEVMVTSFKQKTKIARASRRSLFRSFRNLIRKKFRVDPQIIEPLKRGNVK